MTWPYTTFIKTGKAQLRREKALKSTNITDGSLFVGERRRTDLQRLQSAEH